MTFIEARNLIIAGLEQHLGRPVSLFDQIAPKEDPPYAYYSVLAPRIQRNSFGLETVKQVDDGFVFQRSEPVSATLSFTFCGENRETEQGYVYGEDEALALAEKAHGYFLLYAHRIHTDAGDVVISNVGAVASRSSFLVEDTVRRYGFDVRFNYVRIDEKPTTTMVNPGHPHRIPNP